MSAPLKPWERIGVNNQNLSQPPINAMSSSNLPPCCQDGGGPGISSGNRAPPPIPTRPALQSSTATPYQPGYNGYGGIGGYGGMGGYGGGMGGYGGGMYGGGYGGYSGMGYGGYNRLGYGGDQQTSNSFVQVAEESSRPAFQSIENIVQAVTSVSMMLDSTYQAVYNSFRAVLGVADNFSRMKLQLSQVLSALAIIRTLRYMFRRVLVWLRLRPDGLSEDIWSEVADEAMAASANSKKAKTSWPILMFFGIILGGPWLIWKLVSSVTKNTTQETAEWASGQDDHVVAKAEYSYNGDGNEELSFKEGDKIIVAPRELQPRVRGWLLGTVDGQKVGYVPANYVKILGKRRGQKYQNSMSGQFLKEKSESNQSNSSEHSEQKHCCHGDNKADTVSANQGSDFVSEDKLDSAFVSELPVQDILSDTAEMEASQVIESQIGD